MITEFKTKVIETKNLTSTVKSIKLVLPENFEFKAGQYISIGIDIDRQKIKKPYSICSSPTEKEIELCVKDTGGPGSKYLFSLNEGDEVEFIGPMGKFEINKNSKNHDLIFLAVSTGIAPLKSMIFELLESGFNKKLILIKSARHEEDMLYNKEFLALRKKYSNFEFHNILSQPKKEFENKGYVQDFIDKFTPKNFEGDFYLCGLSPMINSAKEILKSRGVKKDRIFYEMYD